MFYGSNAFDCVVYINKLKVKEWKKKLVQRNVTGYGYNRKQKNTRTGFRGFVLLTQRYIHTFWGGYLSIRRRVFFHDRF